MSSWFSHASQLEGASGPRLDHGVEMEPNTDLDRNWLKKTFSRCFERQNKINHTDRHSEIEPDLSSINWDMQANLANDRDKPIICAWDRAKRIG